jgi:hypothetical protein
MGHIKKNLEKKNLSLFSFSYFGNSILGKNNLKKYDRLISLFTISIDVHRRGAGVGRGRVNIGPPGKFKKT